MARFNYDNYRGEILLDGLRLTFGRAGPGDVPRLAEMYADISINTDNYRVRLDPSSPFSFSRVGGMFKIHTEESIEKEIAGGRSFFAVIKNGGDIAASFWVSESDPHFTDFSPSGFPGCASCRCTLADAMRAGAVVYPRELIVARRMPGIAHAMFHTIFSVMRRAGYTHSLGEVYGVHSYSDGGEPVVIDMLNDCSFRMTCGTGGRCIGVFPRRDISVGCYTVTIESRIFCFDYEAVLPVLARELEALGMDIRFEGDGGA